MSVQINGRAAQVPGSLTVAQLLALHGLEPQRVAVEINERLVRRAEFGQASVGAGDRIEIVTLVGGG